MEDSPGGRKPSEQTEAQTRNAFQRGIIELRTALRIYLLLKNSIQAEDSPDFAKELQAYRGSPRQTRTVETEARILELTRQGQGDGTIHLSSYRLAKELGLSQSSVSRVWRHFGPQPHRLRRYMVSDDPEFSREGGRYHWLVS